MKVVSIVGARPQFIKAVLLSKQLRKYHRELLVHTGQHYNPELSGVFFDELNIPKPDYNLGVGSDTHTGQIARMMIGLEPILIKEKPNLVLVYGDTNSTLAGALVAAKCQIPVAHVEAGPRMFDKNVPEEVNRVITDHVSTLLFAPTRTAVTNLGREGINNEVYLTGDVLLDSFLHLSDIAERRSRILSELGLGRKEYLLATIHRVRNTEIKGNLKSIVEVFSGINAKIVFPVHPRTVKCLKKYGLYEQLQNAPNMVVIKPVGYLDMMALVKNARKIVTDSGGLQKEAYFAKVPCITLDEVTGWPETVESGWNTLVASSKGEIAQAIRHFGTNGRQPKVFGDGQAVQRIAEIITRWGDSGE